MSTSVSPITWMPRRKTNNKMNMNKQVIITCLRGTIGRWPKGKAIVILVLALFAMAGQAQTFQYRIVGNIGMEFT